MFLGQTDDEMINQLMQRKQVLQQGQQQIHENVPKIFGTMGLGILLMFGAIYWFLIR